MATYHTFSSPSNFTANGKSGDPSGGLLESKETDGLLRPTSHEEIVPQLMRYSKCRGLCRPRQRLTYIAPEDVPKGYDTAEKALATDPLDRYLTDTPVRRPPIFTCNALTSLGISG